MTKRKFYGIILSVAGDMRWCSTMAVQLICNQQVVGSSPITSSNKLITLLQAILYIPLNRGEFPSGQRGQTVNLLAMPSVVRIHLLPPEKSSFERTSFFQLNPPSAEEIHLRWMKSLCDEIRLRRVRRGGFNFI